MMRERFSKEVGCILVGVLTVWALHDARAAEEARAQAVNLPFHVSVDPRVELVSVIFRLAGNSEYGRGGSPSYVQDMSSAFEDHQEHPVVKLARGLRGGRGVSYNAPMGLAIHLTDGLGLKGRVPFEPLPPNVDGRWRPEDIEEFLELARSFVEDSGFQAFLDAHQELYDEVVRRGEEFLGRELKLDWFEGFFGQRPGAEFRIVLSMVNWPSNYGASFKQGDIEELYCILGVGNPDQDGIPVIDRIVLDTVAHEFSHSFANPLVFASADGLRQAGERMFPLVEDKMRRQAYADWRTMMCESVVRASVVRYLDATLGSRAAADSVRYNFDRGFVWTGELADLLKSYEGQRDTYETLEAFFPKVVAFFDEYSVGFEEAMRSHNAATPKIVELVPPNGATDVDPSLAELRVTFDRPMGPGVSWVGGGPQFPTIQDGKRPHWTDGGKTCVLPVELKPDWSYRLGLNSSSFKSFVSRDGGVALEPVRYTFGTRGGD